jgi:hypothetical protein
MTFYFRHLQFPYLLRSAGMFPRRTEHIFLVNGESAIMEVDDSSHLRGSGIENNGGSSEFAGSPSEDKQLLTEDGLTSNIAVKSSNNEEENLSADEVRHGENIALDKKQKDIITQRHIRAREEAIENPHIVKRLHPLEAKTAVAAQKFGAGKRKMNLQQNNQSKIKKNKYEDFLSFN